MRPRLGIWVRRQWAVIVLLAVAILLRLSLVLSGWPALDSDEAITGLVTRHILSQGARPIFFWGERYMGALQSYVAAPLFLAFGSSTFVLHLAVLLLTIGFLLAMYALGVAAYGRAVGLLVLGWLALGPPIALLRESAATGGYQDILLFGSLVLLGVWLRLRAPHPVPKMRREWVICLATYAAIGLCAGLGLWSDLLIVPVLLVACVTLLLTRTAELLRGAAVVGLLFFVVGALPYLAYNLANGHASYDEAVTIGSAGTGGREFLLLGNLPSQVGEMLSVAVPVLSGSPHVCVKSGAIWYSYPASSAGLSTVAGGLCDSVNILFSLGLLAILSFVGWTLGRRAFVRLRSAWRARHSWPFWWPARLLYRVPSEPAVFARMWLRAMLVVSAAMYLVIYAISPAADLNQFTSVRYLLPLYFSLPLLLGQLWEWASPELARWTPQLRRARALVRVGTGRWRAIAAGGLALLFAFVLWGGTQTLAAAATPGAFGLPQRQLDSSVIAFLDAHKITDYYSDYWTCYRIAFETNERIICAVRGQNGDPNLRLMNNRYEPYIAKVAADAHPAYILPAETAQDREFDSEAEQEHLPHQGYTRARVGPYAVYYYAH